MQVPVGKALLYMFAVVMHVEIWTDIFLIAIEVEVVWIYNGRSDKPFSNGAASGSNSIYRRTQFTDFVRMIIVLFTYLTSPHDLLPVNHAEQHNSSLNQTEI